MKRKNQSGFTLVELMVAVLLVGIIMGIAVPSYRQYMQRTHRSDATVALLRITAQQEKFYIQNGIYAGNGLLGVAPPNGLGIPQTERNWYGLAIQADPAGLAVGYTVTATALAGERQQDDDDCQVFSINERGVRGAQNSGGGSGPAVVEKCWR